MVIYSHIVLFSILRKVYYVTLLAVIVDDSAFDFYNR